MLFVEQTAMRPHCILDTWLVANGPNMKHKTEAQNK
jgi:hypothetical protein